MDRRREPLEGYSLVQVGSCAVAGVIPLFLYGALAVLIRQDLGFGPTRLGIAAAAFFVSTALVSSAAGRLTEQFGNDRAMILAVGCASTSLLGLALVTSSWWHVVNFLMLGGIGNALAQPATSAVVAALVPDRRHGLAFGVKQLNGPIATILAGLLTPLVAIPFGWRAAFAAGVVVTLPFWMALRVPGSGLPLKEQPESAGRFSSPDLKHLRVAAMLGATTATTLGAFYVSSAVDAGITPGRAAGLLTLGSAAGVVGRLSWGWFSDTGRFRVAQLLGTCMGTGAMAFVLLGTATSSTGLALASVATFATAWSWPGVLLHTVVQTHPADAAPATGYVLAGVAAGGAVGPPLFGAVVEATSYRMAWWTAAAAMALAGALVFTVATRMSDMGPPDPKLSRRLNAHQRQLDAESPG